MRRLKLGAFACVGLLLAFSVQWWGCGPVQHSDWMLKLRFMTHAPELERIVAMSDEDPQMSRIAPDFLWTQDSVAWPRPEPKWGITKERDEHIRIFKQADSDAGAKRGGSDVEIIVWRWESSLATAASATFTAEEPRLKTPVSRTRVRGTKGKRPRPLRWLNVVWLSIQGNQR